MGSLCLGKSHFSTWIFHSAHRVVSKHIEKPARLLVKANTSPGQKPSRKSARLLLEVYLSGAASFLKSVVIVPYYGND